LPQCLRGYLKFSILSGVSIEIIIPIKFKVKIRPPLADWLIGIALFYRRLRYGYAFRHIPLSRGQYAIVDVEDFEELSKYKWYAVPKRDTFYAKRYDCKSGKQVRMHQQIMPAPEGYFIDHENHNGLDNRKANLRIATPAQNACNCRKMLKPCSSKYKGVSLDKDKNQWRAYITYNGRRIHLGWFDNEEDAARAYDAAAKKYFGEFAKLNFENAGR
jgi:hypothetical protein